MALLLYLDHHVPRAVHDGLRHRGVDVLTCAEDATTTLADGALLDRASAMGRVLVSQDRDLLAEANHRQQSAIPFSGVIYAHQLGLSIGQFVTELELTAKACEPDDLAGTVLFLPL